MRRSTLAICALLTVATFGCDTVNTVKEKVKLAYDKLRGRQTATQPAPPARPQRGDTAVDRRAASPDQRPPPQPQRPPPRPTAPPRVAPATRDIPYVSDDTGTIAPGMSERDVYAVWGPPAAVRRAGDFTYLFFQNGCEYTCGTMDVVTLQNDSVVDAIVRWDGHRYAGESSSPPGQVPLPTRGGDTLAIPPAPPPPPPPTP